MPPLASYWTCFKPANRARHRSGDGVEHLLQRAWSRTLAGETGVKPWPWADTWPVARLLVPSQHIDQIVLEGAYGRTLAFGPGHVESAEPVDSAGNIILTGHRDTHFRFLQWLKPVAPISILE